MIKKLGVCLVKITSNSRIIIVFRDLERMYHFGQGRIEENCTLSFILGSGSHRISHFSHIFRLGKIINFCFIDILFSNLLLGKLCVLPESGSSSHNLHSFVTLYKQDKNHAKCSRQIKT